MSDYEPKISFEDALASQFNASTLEELRYYFTQKTGEVAPKQTNSATLRNKLLKACGIANEFTGAKVGVFKPGQEPIYPDYNLTPNGKWGGRRHRIKVAKPTDATKNENIWHGSWNGSAPYFLRYGEVQAVPEPFYLRLRDQKRPVASAQRTVLEDGSVETTTVLKLDDRHSISYFGVDPNTEHLCGSLTEWYQNKGPAWFRQRSERDCQLIAQKLELKWQDEQKRPLPHNDILPRLIEFIFGHADAEAA
jgi:hypothetical protein